MASAHLALSGIVMFLECCREDLSAFHSTASEIKALPEPHSRTVASPCPAVPCVELCFWMKYSPSCVLACLHLSISKRKSPAKSAKILWWTTGCLRHWVLPFLRHTVYNKTRLSLCEVNCILGLILNIPILSMASWTILATSFTCDPCSLMLCS